ncbi:9864_t:CDS:2 [Ambispora gerdemannii]|uniref:9864_t:CDS:1 n=1 Tax=Ambispora gerdemannii TaxID=144530 RepID=A0A9N8W8C8_9GLOM|nr:9864_t:CDS:2 [Ambispora gerdemannii]
MNTGFINQLWADAFPPQTIVDLCGNRDKVGAIHNWLKEAFAVMGNRQESNRKLGGRILVLSGPTGTGKSAAIQVLAKQKKIFLAKYENPEFENELRTEEVSDLGDKLDDYTSVLTTFKKFVYKCKQDLSFLAPSDSQILLFEEWPDLLSLETRKEFHDFLISDYFNDLGAMYPMVFILSEYFTRFDTTNLEMSVHDYDLSLNALLPEEILSNPIKFKEIRFNSLPKPDIERGLIRISKLISCGYPQDLFGIPYEIFKRIAEIIGEESNGDIRRAINEFQYLWTTERRKIAQAIQRGLTINNIMPGNGPEKYMSLRNNLFRILSGEQLTVPGHREDTKFFTANLSREPEMIINYLHLSYPNFFKNFDGTLSPDHFYDVYRISESFMHYSTFMGSKPFERKNEIGPTAIDMVLRTFLNRHSLPLPDTSDKKITFKLPNQDIEFRQVMSRKMQQPNIKSTRIGGTKRKSYS